MQKSNWIRITITVSAIIVITCVIYYKDFSPRVYMGRMKNDVSDIGEGYGPDQQNKYVGERVSDGGTLKLKNDAEATTNNKAPDISARMIESMNKPAKEVDGRIDGVDGFPFLLDRDYGLIDGI